MRCLRIDLSRKLSRYIHQTLDQKTTARLEAHLAACNDCKDELHRMTQGDLFSEMIPSVQPQHDPWRKIEAQISKPMEHSGLWGSSKIFRAVAMLAVVLPAFFLLWKSVSPPVKNKLETTQYRTVSIRAMSENTAPHVVTEGYVMKMRLPDDEGEGERRFKLVESLQQPSPFVVCEIILPLHFKIPGEGQKVRVYGVSRFDGKTEHQWYEVHPVLGIENIR